MFERISVYPGVCHGKPCIRGTRVPVYLILDMLAAREDMAGILEAYPFLKKEDILAAIEYAACVTEEEIVPLKVETG